MLAPSLYTVYLYTKLFRILVFRPGFGSNVYRVMVIAYNTCTEQSYLCGQYMFSIIITALYGFYLGSRSMSSYNKLGLRHFNLVLPGAIGAL